MHTFLISCILIFLTNFFRNHLFKLIIDSFVGETHYVTKTLLNEVIRGSLDTLHIGPDETTMNQIVDINQILEEGNSLQFFLSFVFTFLFRHLLRIFREVEYYEYLLSRIRALSF